MSIRCIQDGCGWMDTTVGMAIATFGSMAIGITHRVKALFGFPIIGNIAAVAGFWWKATGAKQNLN